MLTPETVSEFRDFRRTESNFFSELCAKFHIFILRSHFSFPPSCSDVYYRYMAREADDGGGDGLVFRHPNKNLKTYLKEDTDHLPSSKQQRRQKIGASLRSKIPLGASVRRGLPHEGKDAEKWSKKKHFSQQTNVSKDSSSKDSSPKASVSTLDLDSVHNIGEVVKFFTGKKSEASPRNSAADIGFDEEEKYDPPHIVDVVDEFGLSVRATAD